MAALGCISREKIWKRLNLLLINDALGELAESAGETRGKADSKDTGLLDTTGKWGWPPGLASGCGAEISVWREWSGDLDPRCRGTDSDDDRRMGGENSTARY